MRGHRYTHAGFSALYKDLWNDPSWQLGTKELKCRTSVKELSALTVVLKGFNHTPTHLTCALCPLNNAFVYSTHYPYLRSNHSKCSRQD